VVAYEEGYEAEPPRFVQRIVAVRDGPASTTPPRHLLRPPGGAGQVKFVDSEDSP
jgi:hypothetical protein